MPWVVKKTSKVVVKQTSKNVQHRQVNSNGCSQRWYESQGNLLRHFEQQQSSGSKNDIQQRFRPCLMLQLCLLVEKNNFFLQHKNTYENNSKKTAYRYRCLSLCKAKISEMSSARQALLLPILLVKNVVTNSKNLQMKENIYVSVAQLMQAG